MSKIIQIALKDIRLQFAQKSQWLFFLVLPIMFILIFGSAYSNDDDAGPVGIPMLVSDLDASLLSAELLQTLDSTDGILPETLPLADAEARFDERDVVAVLVIPAGFGDTVERGDSAELDLRIQPSNSNGLIIGQAVQTAVNALSRPVAVAANTTNALAGVGLVATDAERDAAFTEARLAAVEQLETAPAQIVYEQPPNSAESSFDIATQQVTGQLITWVFIPLLGTAVLFTSERTRGTLRRIITTPTSKTTYMLGTVAGQVFLGLLQLAILIGFGIVVFNLNFANDLLGLIIIMVTFVLAAVAMGTTLGTLVKSDGQANNLGIMLGMLMALLGGCWFPYEFFSPTVKAVANFVPTSWALRGILDLSVGGATAIDILPHAGVLLAFAAVFFAIGVWRFRFE